jgi:Integrase core domain
MAAPDTATGLGAFRLTTVRAVVRPRQDLVLENLLLRHQLTALTRPTRRRSHCRRELMHVNLTANPTAAWVWRQLIEATPWGTKPRHLLRDRDAVYGREFRTRTRRIGIDAIATPIHAPKANAIAERVIGTLRRECLDHVIVLDEQHLRSVLAEFVRYYNQQRPHRTLGLQTPRLKVRPTTGSVRPRPVLNGLHHVLPTSRLSRSEVLPPQVHCWQADEATINYAWRPVLSSLRRARFTSEAVGNATATSGSSTTTFVCSA